MFKIIIMLTTLIISNLAHTMELAKIAPEEESNAIKEKIVNTFPDAGLNVKNVYISALEGFYEVEVNHETLYFSKDGKWMIRGEIFDTERSVSYTDEQFYLKNKDKLESYAGTIDYVSNNEKVIAYVFTDPTCPFCKRLSNNIPLLNKYGITVKYIPFPRSGISEENKGYSQSKQIWCSPNKKEAYYTIENGGETKYSLTPQCVNNVNEGFLLGEELNITSTPMVIMNNGVLSKGFSNAADLIVKANIIDPNDKEAVQKLLIDVNNQIKR